MSIILLPKQHPPDNYLAQLSEDTREVRMLVNRLTASLRGLDEQATNLTRFILRIDRNLALLSRLPGV